MTHHYSTDRSLLVFTGTASRHSFTFPTIQRCLRCTAGRTPSSDTVARPSHWASLSPGSLFLESHDRWKDMICILTTAGLLLGSRGVLSKNTPGSSVHLSHAGFHYSDLPQLMLPEPSRSFATWSKEWFAAMRKFYMREWLITVWHSGDFLFLVYKSACSILPLRLITANSLSRVFFSFSSPWQAHAELIISALNHLIQCEELEELNSYLRLNRVIRSLKRFWM